MQNEILAAEIYLHPVNTAAAVADIDEELNRVEQALQSYSCTATMPEYAAAVFSGILSGAIDAFLVGETPIFQEGQKTITEQFEDVIKRASTALLENDGNSKTKTYKTVKAGIPANIAELEHMAANPTPKGMLAAILIQMGRGGMVQKCQDRIQLFPDGVSNSDGILLVFIAVIIGILKWLSDLSAVELEHLSGRFKTLEKLLELIRSAPAFSAVVKEMDKWQRQLPNEMKRKGKKDSSATGVEKAFCSFFMMLGNSQVFQNTDLQKTVHILQEGNRIGLNDVPIIKCLSRQAFPVMINEIIVRTIFFAMRLAGELKNNEDVSGINWPRVLPFGNRDIDRLLAISSMTLSVADTADATIHAAIDSYGDEVLFACKFVTRFNYVAAGRAFLAVGKEISNEAAEAKLIHRKRILTEAKTERVLEMLSNYQEQLENRVSEYIAEDITAFLQGLECMDQGLAKKDSNLVIKGNVIIQRVLGRVPQFTNQQEFDDLMDSDLPLKL